MKQRKRTLGILTLPALVASLAVAAMIHPVSALTQVDVLVAYDTTASAWLAANGTNGADFAAGQISKMNTVLANSGLDNDFTFRLVGTHYGAFTYDDASYNGLYGFIETAVAETNDIPAWTALRNDRDSAGADIVMILVDTGSTVGQVGYSYAIIPLISRDNGITWERQWDVSFAEADMWFEWFAERSYGSCDIASANEGYTMAHEVGHIMGAGHSDVIDQNYAEPGPQLFPYSTALMYDSADGNHYATVMGYNTNGSGDGKFYEVLPYFSSPDLRNPYTNEALGDDNHDNVKTLKATYERVAAFRPARDEPETPPTDPTEHEEDTPDTPGQEEHAAEPSEQGEATSGESEASSGSGTESSTEPSSETVVEVVNYGGVVRDVLFSRAQTVLGALYDATGKLAGTMELKFGKQGKKGVKVAGAATIILDGKAKKVTAKAVNMNMDAASATMPIAFKEPVGTMTLSIGGDGVFTLRGAKYEMVGMRKRQNESFIVGVGGGMPDGTLHFNVAIDSMPDFGNDGVLEAALPRDVPITVSGGKWLLGKAATLKYVKDKVTGETMLVGMDDPSKPNVSGLKLSYAAKTGVFKGSFKMYTTADGDKPKLKKFTVNVVGFVVNGVGYGEATMKKPSAGPWNVTVE